ncbi:MAG: hypothetical protein MMC33_008093 [Icmadophila ericetorum]|nr:hypothetical protein [Icmadophila ericetorum]
MASSIYFPHYVLGALVLSASVFYKPLSLRAEVLGLLRPHDSIQNVHGEDLKIIPDTVQCEDLHHHLPSGLLFAACQGSEDERFSWFPPLANFKDHNAAEKSQGGLYVVDPKTKKIYQTFTSQRLQLEGFSGPFITHGIDLYLESPNSIYIFAVNHLPNPEYYDSVPRNSSIPKASSQIEVFRHHIGSTHAKFLRSVRHPLIRTPNDIYATSTSSFYVTNDHYYREGRLRFFEDVAYQKLAGWSDIVHVAIDPFLSAEVATDGITATIAHSGMHNPNGLGHGKNSSEIIIGRAAAGVMSLAKVDGSDPEGKRLNLTEKIQLQSTIDNPTYYTDPFASSLGALDDASGYVVAGMARAVDLAENADWPKGSDPAMVWLVQPNRNLTASKEKWTRKLIFQDDSKTLRSASAAILIGIDPKENLGQKHAWLFVTGFFSKAIVATKISL